MIYELPPMLSGDVQKQIYDIRDYLIRFAKDVESGSLSSTNVQTQGPQGPPGPRGFTGPAGRPGVSDWENIENKPFERIGETLSVQDGMLDVSIHEVSNDAGGLTTIIG